MRRGSELGSAALAAGSLIAGYGVVAVNGSRALGGIVLLAGGLVCLRIWLLRLGARAAVQLTGILFGAFVLSHLLALAIGAWPSVIVCAALVGGVTAALGRGPGRAAPTPS